MGCRESALIGCNEFDFEEKFIFVTKYCLLITMTVVIFFGSIFAAFSLIFMMAGFAHYSSIDQLRERIATGQSVAHIEPKSPPAPEYEIQKTCFSDIKFTEITSECSICLETFKNEDEVIQLPCSKFHVFHQQCLKEMLNVQEGKNCPLCRQPVQIT
jgi:hypothetical protein